MYGMLPFTGFSVVAYAITGLTLLTLLTLLGVGAYMKWRNR